MLCKNDFVAEFAKRGYTKKDGKVILDDLLDAMKAVLSRGEGISFPGFGKFEVKRMPGRDYVNPQTGETVHTVDRNRVRFTASPILQQTVNGDAVVL